VVAYKIGNRYLASPSSQHVAAATCQAHPGVIHAIVITNNVVYPSHTDTALCDILTITNQDAKDREIAFGEHTHHVPYNGVTEKLLHHGDSLTVILNQAGTYKFHDHYQDAVAGDFTVAE
jgi:hypothetical protein